MKVLLTGATGFIGNELGKYLVQNGHELVVVSRNAAKARQSLAFPCEIIQCDLNHDLIPEGQLKAIQGVIHLAGQGVADRRWSKKQKELVYSSRIRSSENLLASFSKSTQPQVFVSASATGFYGDQEDKILDEDSAAGSGFLADVCKDWEKIFTSTSSLKAWGQTRFVQIRIGLVLSPFGGALLKMLPAFRLGIGGVLGSGNQWASWIHVQDVVRMFAWALESKQVSGVFNAVSPSPVTNLDFTIALAACFAKKKGPPAPAFVLRMALGEMASLLLGSARVVPKRATAAGFHFQYPNLPSALAEVADLFGNGDSIFRVQQYIEKSRSQVFAFFSDARNLEKITPSAVNFHVEKMSTDKIEEGTLIDYKLKIHGVPVHWRTLIKQWQPELCFVDDQVKGPYQKWHHTHQFQDLGPGTLITDLVQFKLPFGLLGWMTAGWLVRKDVSSIFEFRRQMVGDLFR